MPWPKGKPFTAEHIRKRSSTIQKNGKRRKQPDGAGNWQCPTCKEFKARSEYHSCKRSGNGLKSQCKSCHQESVIRTRNPDNHRRKKVEAEARRRARKAGSKITTFDFGLLEAKWGGECLACGSKENLQWDHITPLSLGGEHSICNLQRLCRSCNEIKQARYIDYRTEDQKIWVVEFKRVAQPEVAEE